MMEQYSNKAIDFYLERVKISVFKAIYDLDFGLLFYRKILYHK